MTREIKFRAWDRKRMLFRTLFDRNWYHDDDRLVQEALPRDKTELDVMQYTGLKDKNGVEVYEGDVVRRKYANFESETFFYDSDPVVFRGGAFEIDNLFGAALRTHPAEYEVIGNIYENPELLEES